MQLTRDEERRMGEILRPYREHELVQQLKKYPHHGKVTIYEHVTHVTRACCYLNRRWHLRADERTLVTVAFLHDFYLYDWHQKDASHRWHAFRHPMTASRNAVETFDVGTKERRAIRAHMWPLVPYRLPTSREGWILTVADKYCAVVEIIHDRRQKRRSKVAKSERRGRETAKSRQQKGRRHVGK